MAAILTNNLRYYNAELFKEVLDNASTEENVYLFIGKHLPWDDDSFPVTPNGSIQEQFDAWADIVALKRVTDASSINVIPRYNWDSDGDTIYVPYDASDADMYNHPTQAEIQAADDAGNTYIPGTMYVVTDEFNVYKCIDIPLDADTENQKSTIKPTSTSTNVVEYADGYKWKFMYKVAPSDILKYVHSAWLPVYEDTDVKAAAEDGELYVRLTVKGSGYTQIHDDLLASSTDTTAVLSNDASASNDFYNDCMIFVAGEAKLITDYDGASKTATIEGMWGSNPAGGAEYSILPAIQIVGDGTGAIAKAEVDGGEIVGISMVSVGSGYHQATATITGAGGSDAECKAIISPQYGHGFDPLKELGGHFLMMSVTLAYAEGDGDFPVDNDYRKIGLVKDIFNFGTTDTSTAATLRATKTLTVTLDVAGDNFAPDEVITGASSGAEATVIESIMNEAETIAVVKYVQSLVTGFSDFTTENIVGSVSGNTGDVTALGNPEVERFSGEIIWLEKLRPIARNVNMSETVKVVLEF